MDFLSYLINFIVHVDVYLGEIISNFGIFSYFILFVIIFIETGFVFTPFLPGDSLLFAAGAFSAIGSFNPFVLVIVLLFAAFLGDTVNYWIGNYFGNRILTNAKIPINHDHIKKTQQFYDVHGCMTIFWARFIPIMRTFAPFVAGIGKMYYKKFVFYNALGGFVWVFGFTFIGYFFGNIVAVREHFSLVILGVIILSFIPVMFGFIRSKFKKNKDFKGLDE